MQDLANSALRACMRPARRRMFATAKRKPKLVATQRQPLTRSHTSRDALASLKAALERNLDSEAAWLAYAQALAGQGEIATALALLDAARKRGLVSATLRSLEQALQVRLGANRLLAQAIHFHRGRQLDQAMALYRQALTMWPDLVEAEVNLASALQETGAAAQACDLLRQAIARRPDFSAAHYNMGNVLSALGQDPRTAYQKAVALEPGYAEAWYNLAMAQEAAGDTTEAQRCYRCAITAAPGFAAAHMNLGVLLFAEGRHAAAIEAYDHALQSEPGLAAAQNNRGNALRALGRLDAAAEAYRAAIASDPGLAQAHNHLGNLLRDEGRLEQAAACFRDAVHADPAFAEPLYNLGYVLMELGDVAEGFACLTRHALQVCRTQPDTEPGFKREHDEEQRRYLGPAGADPRGLLNLTGGDALPGPAVLHHPAVEKSWSGDHPVVVIDDFLTSAALAGLRHFCAASTIWREVYDGGYLGAFPEHGVASPLLAQIAMELPARYPRIFAGHPLLQIWAFKYGERVTGIPLHADFAAVNVNFWITPDSANQDPAHGGLIIWDKPAPLDWDFARYNIDADAGRRFLHSQGAKSLTVPYRANRAVIFDSDLFHETDSIRFAPGYGNRRINLTLLYGRRG